MSVVPRQEHWVLRHVNFAIGRGEAIGIVGANGAGKSTLLKMIAGTLQPTEGTVQVNGRIAALLELGMGFSPELTGRQNVAHTAGLMGFGADQVARHMDEIEAFAEVGEYFDAPVRTYSSGMQMRVAFSVATAFRPDLLIVDEALSVGDAYFQHKSFERIREFQRQGTTLLIVSHDRSAIQVLCDRVLLLERGAVIKDGVPEEVMDFYNAIIATKKSDVEVVRLDGGAVRTTSGTGEVRIHAIRLLDESALPVEFVNVGENVILEVEVEVVSDLPELVFGYMIKDRLGQPVFGTNTHFLGKTLTDLRAKERVTFRVAFRAALGVGSYSFAVALHRSETHLAGNYAWRDLALVFNVTNLNRTSFVGMAWIPPEVECLR
jgi:lipopolysaccharide transport system ATP-binding protein